MGAGKRKRKQECASVGSISVADEKNDVSFSEPTKQKKQKASSWLENFLSQKRDLVVPIPPDCELADDTYLREFNLQFVRSKVEKEGAEKEEKDGDSSDDEEGNYNSFQSVEIAIVSRGGKEDVTEEEDEPQTSGKVRLFNLPYRIKEKDVRAYRCCTCQSVPLFLYPSAISADHSLLYLSVRTFRWCSMHISAL